MSGGGAEVQKPLERILGATRRPDGALRKMKSLSINPKWRKEMSAVQVVPPESDQEAAPKPKSKSAKRKKEKRHQIRLTEAQQQKTLESDMKREQLVKVVKLESWREELKLLEDKNPN